MAPPPGQVTAAVTALNGEAAMWRGAAGTMRGAQSSADGLVLDEGALSWAARPTGLLVTYAMVREKAARLLGEGAATFDALAGALSTAAAEYQKDENDAVHRMRGVW